MPWLLEQKWARRIDQIVTVTGNATPPREPNDDHDYENEEEEDEDQPESPSISSAIIFDGVLALVATTEVRKKRAISAEYGENLVENSTNSGISVRASISSGS